GAGGPEQAAGLSRARAARALYRAFGRCRPLHAAHALRRVPLVRRRRRCGLGVDRARLEPRPARGAPARRAPAVRSGIRARARPRPLRSDGASAAFGACRIMSTIVVTGASGFVGRNLCAELTTRGHRVATIAHGRLLSPDLPRELEGADTVVHLA